MKRWLLAAVLALTPSVAHAGCAPGQTPSYDDVRGITVHRFALVGRTWPQFDATFAESYTKDNPNALSAQLNARGHVARHGEFTESSTRTFTSLRDVLRRDGFYDLRLTPQMATYLDGAVDSVSVVRCSVVTTIGMVVGGEYDRNNGQGDALIKLLDDLQTAIFALPWTPSLPK